VREALQVKENLGYSPQKKAEIQNRDIGFGKGATVFLIASEQSEAPNGFGTPKVGMPRVLAALFGKPDLDTALVGIRCNRLASRNPPNIPACSMGLRCPESGNKLLER
jgi:hypothetical protein